VGRDGGEHESMTGAWASGISPPALSGDCGMITLIEGSTFCLSSTSGDILPDRPQGLFVSDTRAISGWRVQVDGMAAEPLTTLDGDRYRATFVGRIPPRRGRAESTLMVLRTRYVGDGMRKDIVLRNVGAEAAGVLVTVAVEADFADLFEVKECRVVPAGGVGVDLGANSLTYTWTMPGDTRSMQVTATSDLVLTPGMMTFRAVVPARVEWSTCLSVQVAINGRLLRLRYQCGERPNGSIPARRLRAWRLTSPTVTTPDSRLVRTLQTSSEDLGALQIHDPDHPDRRVVAAGAPWFMALFGRDSLLTSWMALPLDQQLALGTLQTLAEFQGTKIDPLTEEQPGRIVHEVRSRREAKLALGGGKAYYGTADATPLFVALLGELRRWGLPGAELHTLLPAADRALGWVETYGDIDGDGFVEYRRATDRGLINQGWKDSFDGVNDAAGASAHHRSRWLRYRPTCMPLIGPGRRLPRPSATNAQRRPTRAKPRPSRPPSMSGSGCLTKVGMRSGWMGTSAGWTRSPRTWGIACGAASLTTTRRRSWPTTCSIHGCGPGSASGPWPAPWAPTTP